VAPVEASTCRHTRCHHFKRALKRLVTRADTDEGCGRWCTAPVALRGKPKAVHPVILVEMLQEDAFGWSPGGRRASRPVLHQGRLLQDEEAVQEGMFAVLRLPQSEYLVTTGRGSRGLLLRERMKADDGTTTKKVILHRSPGCPQ